MTTPLALTDDQLARVNQLSWYHSIDFGSHQTRGRFADGTPHNMTLFGVMDLLAGIDLAGLKCVDVGPAHGLVSMGLALGGAQTVSAINIGAGRPPQITVSEEIFGVNIDYHSGTPVEAAGRVFPNGSLDLVVCAGVMYHLLNPADVMFRLRPTLRHGGLMVMETVAVIDDEPARFVLNTERDDFPQPSTYFLPNPAMLKGLAKLACFEVLATRLNSPQRYSMVCRAVQPHEVSDRSPLCTKMHDVGFEDPSFDLDALAPPTLPPLAFTGKTGHQKINIREYTPNFPPHPTTIVNPAGKRFGQ